MPILTVNFSQYYSIAVEIIYPPTIIKGQRQQVPTTVAYEDQFERIGTDVHVIVGRMAIIECALECPGLPAAEIKWTRDGLPLNETAYPLANGREILPFPNASVVDNGTYCCSVENAAGKDEECSVLLVRGGSPILRKGTNVTRPVNPSRVNSGKQTVDIGGSVYATQGSEFEILCYVAYAEPLVTNFVWTYPDVTVGMELVIVDHNKSTNATVVRSGKTEFSITSDFQAQTSVLVAHGNDTRLVIRCSTESALGTDSATSELVGKLFGSVKFLWYVGCGAS